MTIERLVVWGTADLGKPRTRILLSGLRDNGVVVGEALHDLWNGVEDKSALEGVARYARLALNLIIAYPILIWRYLRLPKHETVFVAYMGHVDVLVLWPFAKLRGAKIVWDAFLSLYDTVVIDRRLVKERGIAAKFIHAIERLAGRAADVIVLDTQSHADYFRRQYNIRPEKLISVWVGAEENFFSPPEPKQRRRFRVLFYGQFIPLHGVEHIIDAARQVSDPDIEWAITGKGQEAGKIKSQLGRAPIASMNWIEWIDYDDLPAFIADTDICLGIFGTSDKAARVIPNKVFQIIAGGRPLITRDSPAIREILTPQTPGVQLVEAGSGEAIARAVEKAKTERRPEAGALYREIRDRITPEAIGETFLARLRAAL